MNNKNFKLYGQNKYIDAHNKLNFQCLKCTDIFDLDWEHLYLRDYGCPYCSGRRVGKFNNLKYLRPDLAKEWSNKNKIHPNEITLGSDKKVWWTCKDCECDWFVSPSSRTNMNSGCLNCFIKRKESKIANELKLYCYKNYKSEKEYKIFKNPETGRWLPYDIYIPSGKDKSINGIYIEVHGDQHYIKNLTWYKRIAIKYKITIDEAFKNRKKIDRMKRKYARKNGTYIEIDLRKIKTIEQAIDYLKSNMIANKTS